jgi:hypothetical protein
MKFNWGTGIALFYSVFVVALVFQVIKSTQYDHSLVSEKYYAKDLAYQEHYDKLVNSQQLEKDLQVIQNESKTAVTLEFPEQLSKINGEIHFFCPSDSRQDFRLPVRPNANNQQVVSTQDLKPGLWRVKVDWKAEGKAYFKEEVIVL